MSSILKEKHDISEWPYILESPTDDVSFYPFDNSVIRSKLYGCMVGLPGAMFVLTAAVVGILYVLGVL